MTRSVFTVAYARMCELLIAGRRAQGMTQADVAQALGRPQSFVAKYERGERRLDLVEFLEVAAVLRLDADAVVAEVRAGMTG